MINIASILKHVLQGVANKNPQYQVLDSEHIVDTKTSAQFHLYDDWAKVTYDDEVIITKSDFTQEEQKIIWAIKECIVDPAEVERKKANYQELLSDRRQDFASLFESPEPLDNGFPVEEADTEEYKG